jgi:hypothetical protein
MNANCQIGAVIAFSYMSRWILCKLSSRRLCLDLGYGRRAAGSGFEHLSAAGARAYGIKIDDVCILSPDPAMTLVGVTTSSPAK